MLWKKTEYKIVSPREFDKLFKNEATIANLSTPKVEKEYEKRDSMLIKLLKDTVASHSSAVETENIYIGQDWWPDHTRHIEIDFSQCTLPLLAVLQDKLKEEFSSYRIQLCVYRSIYNGDSYIGSVVLYQNRRLIEKPLYDLLIVN